MFNYPIQNITNLGKTIVLFNRQADGKLEIKKDFNFYPYFYQLSPQGFYRTIDNKRVNNDSYEADVLYCKRYLIDKVEEITKVNPKYLFIDVEIQTDRGIPDYNNPDQRITCITIYNSYNEEIRTWFIKDVNWLSNLSGEELLAEQENRLLMGVIEYIKKEQHGKFAEKIAVN